MCFSFFFGLLGNVKLMINFRGHIFSAQWSPQWSPPLQTFFPMNLWELYSVFCVHLCQRLFYKDLIWNVRTDRSRSQTKRPTHLFFFSLTFYPYQPPFKYNSQRIVEEHEQISMSVFLLHGWSFLMKAKASEMTKINKSTLFNRWIFLHSRALKH